MDPPTLHYTPESKEQSKQWIMPSENALYELFLKALRLFFSLSLSLRCLLAAGFLTCSGCLSPHHRQLPDLQRLSAASSPIGYVLCGRPLFSLSSLSPASPSFLYSFLSFSPSTSAWFSCHCVLFSTFSVFPFLLFPVTIPITLSHYSSR